MSRASRTAPKLSFPTTAAATRVSGMCPGGVSPSGGTGWVACRRGFFLPLWFVPPLFGRLLRGKPLAAHQFGLLDFLGADAALPEPRAFAAFLAPLRKAERVVD